MRYLVYLCLLIFCCSSLHSFAEDSLRISEVSLQKELHAHIKINPNPNQPNRIGRILINDRTNGITQATWLYVKQALDYYQESKPDFVILELNTPGGEIYSAQLISDALKNLDIQFNIPVVAYINNWAISAGAMLAYSCRFIVVVKDASMGAAEPVIAGELGEMLTASEKINSAMRTDLANRASFFGRNPDLAEAMVDKDIILVLRDGHILKLDNESQLRLSGENPDLLISPKGKLLTLNAEQLMKYGVADFLLLPAKTRRITEEEKTLGKWPASKEMIFQVPFFNSIPNAIIDEYQMDWKTRLFVFLANPIVASLLMLGLMIGAYIEFSTPGVTLPGSIAAMCLFLIILSTFSLQLSSWLELILLLSGILILLIELFVLPTFGLLGFFGVVLFVVGLFGMLLPQVGSIGYDVTTHSLNSAGEVFFERLALLSGTLVLGIFLILFLGRFLPSPLKTYTKLISSGNEQEASRGYIAGLDPKKLPQPGSIGVVISTLRPAGKVMINDVYYDALSEGNFIEKGKNIIVTRLDGSVLVVDLKLENGDLKQ